ncbi:MAG: hypothetical protein HBSIN02_08030 [Bacteroidia bacterium]|nr:MAG: hypothetical protein HBSIN02_08030 [Bacteroidia bacterium]
MRRYKILQTVVAFSCVLAAGCEEDLNPKGPFLDALVVFGVLSPGKTEHIVRVTTTYDPPAFDPLEHTWSNQITNAMVTVEFGGNVVQLRDTTFARSDTKRYQDSIKAYVFSAPALQRGAPYTLSVAAPGYGTVTATTTPPSTGTLEIDLDSRPAITTPDVSREDLIMYAQPANDAEGHMVRIFLEYEVVSQNPGVILREEIPLVINDYQDCLTYQASYPKIRRRQNIAGRELWIFPNENYRRTILKILKYYDGEMVSFKRVAVVLVQADEHLYKYYSLVGGFRDEFSIRVDEPNYTNIRGGLGVFGAVSADTIFVGLPMTFPNITCPF